MRFETVHERRGFLFLFPMALFMTACMENTIEVTLNPDGSGTRVEHMEVSENSEMKLEPRHFATLVGVNEGEGWTHATQLDSGGDTVHTFDRSIRIGELSDWSQLNGSVKIEGALETTRAVPLGYVTLRDVRFHNAVRVRRAADSEGPTAFTYRETFSWDQAVDAVVEFLMADLDEELLRRFPELTPWERGQVVGFARARFWVAVEEGLLSGDGDEERLLEDAVAHTLGPSLHIIRMKHPGTTEELLESVLTSRLVDFEDRLVQFLEEDLPGLNVALNSEIVFRLNMPGRVTRSNAHRREGTTLVWEFGPGDAFYTPIEVYAESLLER